ncbi:hypothetical protein DL93DRAFT_1705394 [Clavulina sp. PMI_390]|nr:hypothetical protein DL93DRAFT_1705394 [Clavulina sp. PMI_390]
MPPAGITSPSPGRQVLNPYLIYQYAGLLHSYRVFATNDVGESKHAGHLLIASLYAPETSRDSSLVLRVLALATRRPCISPVNPWTASRILPSWPLAGFDREHPVHAIVGDGVHQADLPRDPA